MYKLGRTFCHSFRSRYCEQIQISKYFLSAYTIQYNNIKEKLHERCKDHRETKLPILTIQNNWRSYCNKSSQNGERRELLEYNKVIKHYSLNVPSFGGAVCTKSSSNVKIKSADPTEYQNLDKAFVRLLSCVESNNCETTLNVKQEDSVLSVDYTEENEEKVLDYKLEVEVPIVYNVKVTTVGKADVEVYDLIESNYVDIETKDGKVKIHKIMSENVIINTHSGDVVCQGALQGDVKIKTINGNIESQKRFIGPNAVLETDSGNITVSSSYSDISKFSINRGSMNLKNIHNESHVNIYENGNCKMQGVDGSTTIFVRKGDLDIQISRINSQSRIHVVEGNVCLKLSDSHPMNVSINAKNIIPDSKFHSYGKIENNSNTGLRCFNTTIEPHLSSESLIVTAENGTVAVEIQDWATSIGFKLPSLN